MPNDSKPASHLERIWQVVADVPAGFVLTYGQTARLAGFERAARLVGQALKQAPPGMNLPWHRIINAQGRISFPEGSELYRIQTDRLIDDGIEIIKGRIDLERYGYQAWLDKMIWQPVSEPE